MERGGDEITEHDEITRKYSTCFDNESCIFCNKKGKKYIF